MIPFLAVALAIIKTFAGLDFLATRFEGMFIEFLQNTAGTDAGVVLKKLLKHLSTRSWGFMSATALFVTSLGLFLNMEAAVNRIWGTTRERRWWKRFLLCLGFYLLIPFGLSLYAGLRSLEDFKPLFRWNPLFWDAILGLAALMFVNKLMPATKVPWRNAFVGSFFSTAGLAVLKVSFTWLTISVFNYSKVYGSLAALPLLCLWILVAWNIVLTGVAFCASLQK